MPHAVGRKVHPLEPTSIKAEATFGRSFATVAASVVFHAVIGVSLVLWIALRSLGPESLRSADPLTESGPAPSPGPLDLPVVGEGILLESQPIDSTGEPPRVNGGATVPRPDTGAAGHGGEAHVPVPALNMSDSDERMRLSPDLLSRLDRDQLQRMRVARARQSWEDRRSTTHPMELTLVVTGTGTVLERRAASASEPSRGALQSPSPSVLGASLGASSNGEAGESEHPPGAAQAGSLLGSPGTGMMNARTGLDHRDSAPIGSARPDVTLGPVAMPANEAARPRDNVDTDQEVATTVRSLLNASTAGGMRGEGQGGAGGGGEVGSGGQSGAGSRARPLGVGEGETFDFWTTDPRLAPYFRQLHARIDPLWVNAFPRSALLELKQGTVILTFVVHADGHASVQWPPLRPSGVDEFDRNCADAIRRAGPFPPIPRELGVSSLTIRAPFVASNPAVR